MRTSTLREKVETIRGHKYIRLKTGRLITFWDALGAAEGAHSDLGRALSRAFKLADGEWDLERIAVRLDELTEHINAMRKHLEEVRGVRTKRERIALLRNTTGRSPEEAAAYRRKADELERQLADDAG